MAEDFKPFDKSWKDLRLRRRVFWGLFAGYLPFGTAIAAAWKSAGYTPDGRLAYTLIPYMLFWAGSGVWMSLFTCPRCEAPFFRRPGKRLLVYHNPYAIACLNCNLPVFAKANEKAATINTGIKSRSVRIFEWLALPLWAVNSVVAACLILWSMDSRYGNPVPNDMAVWFTLSSGLTVFLCFLALNSIRDARIQKEMTRFREGPMGLSVSIGLAVAGIAGVVTLATSDLGDPDLMGSVFRRPVGMVLILMTLILSSILLFFTRSVCARLFKAR
jgi:hypothetical protein